MNPFVSDLLNSLIAGLFVFAALRDVATRTVPNWVSFAILAFAIVVQSNADRIFTSTALGSLVFMALLPMWYRGWLGGADVKLLAAGTVAVAPTSVTHFLFTVSLTGGVVAILYLALSLLVRDRPPARAQASWHGS